MRQLVRIKFGSHLYGTSTPASDVDYKSVFVPSARDILLQRAKGTMSDQRPKAEREKNYAGEVEEEKFSLQRFLGLAAEGQTVSLDVLFAPEWAWIGNVEPEWLEVVVNRHRLLTKKSAAFIGYARQQANKYGIKGSRVAAARTALSALEDGLAVHGAQAKLGIIAREIEALAATQEHMSFPTDTAPHGQTITMWDVCNRKMPYTASIKSARDVMARMVDEYGKRALEAESQQGIDWKALSHAVRVGNQAIELLTTGHVTFPLPNAAHILEIKLGRRLYQDVAAEIEDLLIRVEGASAVSSLPDSADLEWIDNFVADVHEREITLRSSTG